MKRLLSAASAAAFVLPVLALAQAQLPTKEPAKPAAPASREGPVATVNGVAIPRQRVELIVRQQAARGAQDSVEMRARIREVLINNELIAQEAAKSGIAKKPEVQTQLEMARQEVLVNNFVSDYITKHPVTDAEVQKEYERAKAQSGDKEYRARHILVETEDQAKDLIAQLKKGAKFEELATKHSKDPGSAQRGGDLDWTVPGTFVQPFSDAMVRLEKGKYTEQPVQTQFGFHVIQLDDVRQTRFPAFAEVKPRIQQQLTQHKVDELIRGLRAKAKVE